MIEIGQRIGNYEVTKKLGEGGMGAVFEAVHTQIARQAAIKVLLPQYAADPHVAQRFLNEARAVNLIDHPGIVEIFDMGRLPDNSTYIIMELLRGETLSHRIERRGGRLMVPEATHLLRQLAAALTAAHAAGVVHRDLKPDNIMIVRDTTDASGERAIILDFGIAKLNEPDEQGTESVPVHKLTRTGAVMGTAFYMSPEQCTGSSGIDSKSDVYSLGVILFQLLAGRLPFLAEGVGAVMAMHIYEAPPSLRAFSPDCPQELETLCVSMMSKDRWARPSMTDVLAETSGIAACYPFSRSELQSARPPVSTVNLAGHPMGGGARSTLHGAAGQQGNRTTRWSQSWPRWCALVVLISGGNLTAWYAITNQKSQRSEAVAASSAESPQHTPSGLRLSEVPTAMPSSTSSAKESVGTKAAALPTPPTLVAGTTKPAAVVPLSESIGTATRGKTAAPVRHSVVRRSKGKQAPKSKKSAASAAAQSDPGVDRESIPETPDFD